MKENQSIMITNSKLPICSYMIAGYYGNKGARQDYFDKQNIK